MKFDLVAPCVQCPFRSDIQAFLRKARVRQIIREVTDGQATFACHKTVNYDDKTAPTDGEQHCAGALIMLERLGRPNQMMRWMERVGAYDRRKLKTDAPVFATPAEMVRAQK